MQVSRHAVATKDAHERLPSSVQCLDLMKPFPVTVARYLLSVLLLMYALTACSEDAPPQGSHYDAAAIDAAPKQSKAACDYVCASIEEAAAWNCTAIGPATHTECYIYRHGYWAPAGRWFPGISFDKRSLLQANTVLKERVTCHYYGT
ncbi:MAG TPA: hypothetical protein VKP30_14655 [Polyangiaceae bacterium]|nr:hypothetical protein [Polyangiaceae bacterium]